jgi:hypothetical protein
MRDLRPSTNMLEISLSELELAAKPGKLRLKALTVLKFSVLKNNLKILTLLSFSKLRKTS